MQSKRKSSKKRRSKKVKKGTEEDTGVAMMLVDLGDARDGEESNGTSKGMVDALTQTNRSVDSSHVVKNISMDYQESALYKLSV